MTLRYPNLDLILPDSGGFFTRARLVREKNGCERNFSFGRHCTQLSRNIERRQRTYGFYGHKSLGYVSSRVFIWSSPFLVDFHE